MLLCIHIISIPFHRKLYIVEVYVRILAHDYRPPTPHQIAQHLPQWQASLYLLLQFLLLFAQFEPLVKQFLELRIFFALANTIALDEQILHFLLFLI